MTAPPDFVLPQEEGEEHEQTPVMYHPPDVNISLHPVHITGIPVDTLGHQNSQLSTCSNTNCLCVGEHCEINGEYDPFEHSSLTYEHIPGGSPPPAVRPGNDDSVVLHASQTSSLDPRQETDNHDSTEQE